MFRTAIAQAHKTEYHCAEKALASGSVQTAAGHGVPTSIQDPLFSWRYRQSHEERDVSLRSRASIQQHAKPPGRIQNIGSLHSTSQQSDTGLDAEQRPMACLFPGSGSQFPNMGSFLLKDFKVGSLSRSSSSSLVYPLLPRLRGTRGKKPKRLSASGFLYPKP